MNYSLTFKYYNDKYLSKKNEKPKMKRNAFENSIFILKTMVFLDNNVYETQYICMAGGGYMGGGLGNVCKMDFNETCKEINFFSHPLLLLWLYKFWDM